MRGSQPAPIAVGIGNSDGIAGLIDVAVGCGVATGGRAVGVKVGVFVGAMIVGAAVGKAGRVGVCGTLVGVGMVAHAARSGTMAVQRILGNGVIFILTKFLILLD